MKIDSLTLANEDILGMLSKTEPNHYCVFIQPNGIVNPSRVIKDLKLECSEGSLMAEDLLLEIYENKDEAVSRVKDYKEWTNHFYVSCYKNGEYCFENA